MHRRTFIAAAAAGAVAGALPRLAFGQGDYPNHPVRLVVGFPPGGSADMAARMLAERLGAELRQPIIVENRAGAAGNIGGESVARAPADGYTLLMAAAAQIGINPSLYPKMGYNPAKDLAPVSLVQNEHNLMVVHPSVPAHNVKEFIAWAKTNPDKATFASPGIGSPAHLAGVLMNQMAGLTMLHVPYKGSAPAISDLLAGNVTMAIDNMPPYLPQVRAGKLRALAVASPMRAKAAPDIPTIAESGLPGYAISAWKGLMAPAGTPTAIIERLHQAVVRSLATPELQQRMLEAGAEPVGNTPAQFGAFIENDMRQWGTLIKSIGLTLE